MKILVAVDENPYSANSVEEVAKLAANTWAKVTILGVLPKGSPGSESSVLILRKLLLNRPL